MFGKKMRQKMGQLEGAQKGMFYLRFWASGWSVLFFCHTFSCHNPPSPLTSVQWATREILKPSWEQGFCVRSSRMPFAGDVPSCPTRLAVTGFD